MTSPGRRKWIVLSQSHSCYSAIDDDEILEALPRDVRDGPRERVRIESRVSVHDLANAPWDELQRDQADLFTNRLEPLLAERRSIAFFGATFVPLAMDLGYRVKSWSRSAVYLHHHLNNDWLWPGRGGGVEPPAVQTEHNLPEGPSNGHGPVVVRVATTVRITREDTHAVVPNALAEIDVHLGDACGEDALESREELERVVRAYRDCLYRLKEKLPQAGPIHLFAAVPVGLAFRLGQVVNRSGPARGANQTMHPLIQTYKYVSTASPRYRKALVLGGEPRPDMKLKILFIAAAPSGTDPIGFDKELREVRRRLRDGEHREKFDEIPEPRVAAQARDMQDYLRRGRAHVVHISAHGEKGGYVLLEDLAGNPQRIAPESMSLLFEVWNEDRSIRCVVVNACHSYCLARILTEKGAVPCAIGTRDAVEDEAAEAFAEAFYGVLADGYPIERAFKAGTAQVHLANPAQADLFEIYVTEEAMLSKPLYEL